MEHEAIPANPIVLPLTSDEYIRYLKMLEDAGMQGEISITATEPNPFNRSLPYYRLTGDRRKIKEIFGI